MTLIPSGRTGRRRGGFTLIEMMTVIVMIGLLAGIALSRLDWSGYRAQSVGRSLMADLTQAQRTAVSLQTDVRVSQASNTQLMVVEDANNNGTADAGERVTYSSLETGFEFGLGTGGANLASPASGTPLTAVVFRRDGTASASGTFYVHGPAVDSVCRYCRAVEITRATGRVAFYSHSTGSWKRAN